MTLPEYQPAVVAAETLRVRSFIDNLGPLDVETEEDVDAVTERGRKAKALSEKLTERRKVYTAPLDAEKAKWMKGYNPLTASLDAIVQQVGANLTLRRKIAREEAAVLKAEKEAAISRALEEGRMDDAAAAMDEVDAVPEKGYIARGSQASGRWKGWVEDFPTLFTWLATDPARIDFLFPVDPAEEYEKTLRGVVETAINRALTKQAQETHAESTIPGTTFRFIEGTSLTRAGL